MNGPVAGALPSPTPCSANPFRFSFAASRPPADDRPLPDTMHSQRPPSRTKKRSPLRFTATCATGVEPLVAEEIERFGGLDPTVHPGAVTWEGSLESGYRACLWSRFASRILLELAEFAAPDADALYAGSGSVLWDEHFSGSKTFAVHCTLVNASLTHSQYAALRVKDAVVDQFRKRFGKRPDVDARRPDIRIHVHVLGTRATLSLDLSGESLHRRGYRTDGGEAPLKETLAAAIVHLSGWKDQATPDTCLLDPMCGSGTLLIEAALLLGNSAPGLQRKAFGFTAWNRHDPQLWDRLVKEALEQEERGQPQQWPQFIGYDADPAAVAAARNNVVAAGLRGVITIKHRQLARLQPPGPKGFILTNPPYGERLSEKEAVKYLYRCLGRVFRNHFANWRLGFFTANTDLAEMTGMLWDKRFRLFNGPLKCQLLVGSENRLAPEPPAPDWQPAIRDIQGAGEDFANRLVKNCAALLPWAREEGITCLRIYDGDIPSYNLAVDLYEEWIHVQEYAPPATVDKDKAEERFSRALQVIRTVLDVPRSRIFIKTRQKQKGAEQYQKKPGPGVLHEVGEGGARFLVNFTDYLDTGLFLDHRQTRARIRDLVKGRTFLNLYGYTGSATVYAAMGDATATTTVDISETYLTRARANLALNGFGGPLHQLVEADCLQWLRQCQERFGVIFLDPPTFSNSRHRKQTFDVQRDHPELLRLAMQRLAKGGVLLFSTNFRKFQLDEGLARDFSALDISDQTIPPDFQRNRRIHRCWAFRHHQDTLGD